jgi:hypothetical protein
MAARGNYLLKRSFIWLLCPGTIFKALLGSHMIMLNFKLFSNKFMMVYSFLPNVSSLHCLYYLNFMGNMSSSIIQSCFISTVMQNSFKKNFTLLILNFPILYFPDFLLPSNNLLVFSILCSFVSRAFEVDVWSFVSEFLWHLEHFLLWYSVS